MDAYQRLRKRDGKAVRRRSAAFVVVQVVLGGIAGVGLGKLVLLWMGVN